MGWYGDSEQPEHVTGNIKSGGLGPVNSLQTVDFEGGEMNEIGKRCQKQLVMKG